MAYAFADGSSAYPGTGQVYSDQNPAQGQVGTVMAQAQSTYLPYYFNIFAGNAPKGDGTGSQAGFNYPLGVAVDSAGNVP